MEVIKKINKKVFNPNTENYSDKIIKIVEKVNCCGSLFEHMEFFSSPDIKKYIGNGIQYFGKYRRVQPYIEIKKSMVAIIEKEYLILGLLLIIALSRN